MYFSIVSCHCITACQKWFKFVLSFTYEEISFNYFQKKSITYWASNSIMPAGAVMLKVPIMPKDIICQCLDVGLRK